METPTDVSACPSRTVVTTEPTNPILDQDPLIDTAQLTSEPQPVESSSSSCSRLFGRCKGITYAILSSTIFTLSTFIIKQLGVDLYDALLCRFSLQTILLTGFMFYKHYKFLYGSSSLILIQIVRSFVSCAGLLLFYASYNYIPLPDLTTVRYTQVIWTAIIAMLVFRERISLLTVIAILLTCIGVICVAQPTFLFKRRSTLTSPTPSSSTQLLGFGLALGSAISFSLSIVLNKRLLIVKIPHSIIIYQFALVTLAVLIVHHIYHRFVLRSYDERAMFTWQYAVGVSVCLFQLYSSTIVQKAFKLEHPSIVTIAQSSDILFAVLLQNLFTPEKSNGFVLIGAAFVMTSIVLVASEKLSKDTKEKTTQINSK